MTQSKKEPTPPRPLPRRLDFRLRLDSRQVTQALRYQIQTMDGEICDYEPVGSFAGTFNFRKGDDIQIVVDAVLHEYENAFPDLSVIDGTIVCIPRAAGPGDQPDLSPFDPDNACTSVSAWSDPEPIAASKVFTKDELTSVGKPDKIKCVQVTALQSIIVGANEGQWQMSGYLSTLYRLGSQSYSRLYFFDPEGSIGSGTGFGPP